MNYTGILAVLLIITLIAYGACIYELIQVKNDKKNIEGRYKTLKKEYRTLYDTYLDNLMSKIDLELENKIGVVTADYRERERLQHAKIVLEKMRGAKS